MNTPLKSRGWDGLAWVAVFFGVALLVASILTTTLLAWDNHHVTTSNQAEIARLHTQITILHDTIIKNQEQILSVQAQQQQRQIENTARTQYDTYLMYKLCVAMHLPDCLPDP